MKKDSNYTKTKSVQQAPTEIQIPLPPHFRLISFFVMIILPVACSFGLNFLYTYYAGDIEHQILPVILNYAVKLISEFFRTLFLAYFFGAVIDMAVKKSSLRLLCHL